MTELIEFDGLQLAVAADGTVGPVTGAAGSGPVVADQLKVWLPEPWQPGEATVLHDEVSRTWLHPDGAHAVLRQVWDLTWTIRVSVVNPTADELVVPGPLLELTGPWPVTQWAAGARALTWLPVPAEHPGDQRVFALRLTRGSCRVQGTALASPPLTLTPAGSARASQTWSWLVELTDRAALTSALPRWWPARVTGEVGDEWELALPDGTVTGPHVQPAEAGFVLIPEPGVTSYAVDEAGERALLELWAAPSLAERVSDLLASHPLRRGPIDPAITVLALAARRLGVDPELWEDHLEAADELIEPDLPPELAADPMTLMALALLGQGAGATSDLLAALASWPSPADRPGRWLALVQARWTALLAGLDRPQTEPATDPNPNRDRLQAAVSQGEPDLVAGQVTDRSRELLSLIDATVPAQAQISDELVAVIAVAAGFVLDGPQLASLDQTDPLDQNLDLAPDHLDEDEEDDEYGAGPGLSRGGEWGLAVQQAKQRLLAGSTDLRALAWLASGALGD